MILTQAVHDGRVNNTTMRMHLGLSFIMFLTNLSPFTLWAHSCKPRKSTYTWSLHPWRPEWGKCRANYEQTFYWDEVMIDFIDSGRPSMPTTTKYRANDYRIVFEMTRIRVFVHDYVDVQRFDLFESHWFTNIIATTQTSTGSSGFAGFERIRMSSKRKRKHNTTTYITGIHN